MKKFSVAILLFSSFAFAISPQFWEENTQQQFNDGDPQSVSINSDGELLLAPQMKKHYEGKDAIIWKIVHDRKGNLFAATGNDGKIIKIDSSGNGTTFFDSNELEVQAIVMDENDVLYAATSPNGKIYRITPDGNAGDFFDPPEKYIWSLVLDEKGNLYAGTGDEGKIYKINPDGKGEIFFDTTENNITDLAFGKDGKLLAGSDRNGILYSIDQTGKAFVLFDSDLQQISAIYPTEAGEVFFATISGLPSSAVPRPTPEIRQPAAPTTTLPSDVPEGEVEIDSGSGSDVVSIEINPPVVPSGIPQTRPAGSSQLYRLNTDGFAELLYSSEDQILDIAGYREGMVLISTGKKAKLISVEVNKKSTTLVKTPEEQITSLLSVNHSIWIATANPGNIYRLVEQHSSSGTYYSDVKDTQTTSSWGRISWKAIIPEGTTLRLSTRTGNTRTPDETWSSWQDAGTDPAGKQIQNPRARFIQWKAEFTTTNPQQSPSLRSVSIAYLQQNLRPEITAITIHPPGVVFRRQIFAQDSFAGVSETATGQRDQMEMMPQMQSGLDQGAFGLGKREIRKGFQTITWNASDQNQDELRFDVFYRSMDEKIWRPLAKNLKERVYAWDTQTLPDGTYLVKIVVNDKISNPEEYVLTNEKESEPFDVDNSPPEIQVISHTGKKNDFVIEVQARDHFSPIREMQYSIVPGEWMMLFPKDSINDSPVENYRISLRDVPPEVSYIVLKCTDKVQNTTTIKHKLERK